MVRSTGNALRDEQIVKGENAEAPYEEREGQEVHRFNDETGTFEVEGQADRVVAGGPAVQDVIDADTLGNTDHAQPRSGAEKVDEGQD